MIHKLLITPITKSHAKVLGIFNIKKVVQNNPLEYGVKIKNINKKNFPGGNIKDINIEPGTSSQTVGLGCNREFSVKALNPEESTKIWFEETTLEIDGSVWLRCEIVPLEAEDKITMYQWDKNNNKPTKISSSGPNKWRDTIFVTNEASLQQTITNYLLVILTISILLDQIFGMKKIGIIILKAADPFLTLLLDIIFRIIEAV